ncbi:MAG: hypothetical protein AAF602_08975 [Myxococcota bacterium]
MVWLWLACSVTEPGGTPETPSVDPATLTIAAASFLEGCWVTAGTTTPRLATDALATGTTECWKPRRSHLNGALTDRRPEASPSLQLMRIGAGDRGLELSVQIAGDPPGGEPARPVLLPLVEATEGRLRFAADGEGFPSEATYALVDRTLTSTYRGKAGGDVVERAYTMRPDAARAKIRRDIEAAFEAQSKKQEDP